MDSSAGDLPLFRHCNLRRFQFWFAVIALWWRFRPSLCYVRKRETLSSLPADTKLFFRYFCNNANNAGVPVKAGIPCPDQSVNCAIAGGQPWYLLLPEPRQSLRQHHRGRCSGIVELDRRIFPLSFEVGAIKYTAQVEHAPMPHNYQHCEVRIYTQHGRLDLENAKLMDQVQYEKLVTAYRALIGKKIRPILWPNACTRPANWDQRRLAKTACASTCPR
jgi:hypothetical protein